MSKPATPAWSRPAQLRQQLLRLWERGELLRDLVTGHARFPLRLALKAPSSTDITGQFDAVRNWTAELAATPALRIDWREVRHRVQGRQQLPDSVWIDNLDSALLWIGKRNESAQFAAQLDLTRQNHPALLPWLEKRPLQALALHREWPRLLDVVGWRTANPRPKIYLRQIDLPGIHSKFIEAHRGVLTELLDLALPIEEVDTSRSGTSQFAARYGFLDKPVRIRFRLLDPVITTLPALEAPDITLDADSFSQLQLPVRQVFITENEINFLAFPPCDDAMVIFGAGYGWDALAKAQWLNQCSIHYWGDIDTHGFAILNQLRHRFPHVQSLLMDQPTLEAHRDLWGTEDKSVTTDLPLLTAEERHLYDQLRDNRIRPGLRLEQERIGFNWLRLQLRELPGNE